MLFTFSFQASCSRTFSSREGTLGHDHAQSHVTQCRIERGSQFAQCRHALRLVTKGSGDRDEVMRSRRPKELLESRFIERSALGEKREDPSSAIVRYDKRARATSVAESIDETPRRRAAS